MPDVHNSPRQQKSSFPENELNREEIDILRSVMLEANSTSSSDHLKNDGYQEVENSSMHPAIKVGLTCAFLANAAILLSLPPVIKGKGAPFLPTAAKGLDVMFDVLRNQPRIQKSLMKAKQQSYQKTNSSSNKIPLQSIGKTAIDSKIGVYSGKGESISCQTTNNLKFVDLGSGDGRVVFRAAREGMFSKCVGYEINPILHGWAVTRRILQAPTYWNNTQFHIKDLWAVDLRDADVVAVYGLHPIMQELGLKMKKEMKPGSIVVSNVFVIPGWRPMRIDGNKKSAQESNDSRVHLYSIPECFEN